MKFSELNLCPALNQAIESQGFVDCTPVQEAAIPYILEGKDVAGLAQTGTGKTAAYLLPLIERILQAKESSKNETPIPFKDWKGSEYILILVPTRELAEQVFENCQTFGKATNLKSIAIYGGTSYEPQKKALKEGVQFVIATPGRLIDLYKEHVLDLKQVRAVVFDEADRMFDMGFKDDAKYILRRIPEQRQFLVFSATLNFDVLNVAYQFGANPIEINVSKDRAKADHVTDEIFHIGQNEKPKYLLSLLKKYNPHQAIIFSNFKSKIECIVVFLTRNGVPAIGISSLLTQVQRNRVMTQFKSGNNQNILVATDVAARGLDIKGVDMVVNFDMPDDPENYVHRIGRTGRAGEEGIAFSIVSDRDVPGLERIESYLEYKIKTGWLEDADLVKDFQAYPKESEVNRYPLRGQLSKKASGRSHHKSHRKKRQRSRHQKHSDQEGSESTVKNEDKSTVKHESKSTHRDRRTGRHKRNENRVKRSQNPKDSHDNKKKKLTLTKASNQKESSKRKKVYRYRAQDSQPKPVPAGQKISNFIKKLFS